MKKLEELKLRKANLVKEMEHLIFISSGIDAEKEVLEIIINFKNWFKDLANGTPNTIPKNSIFKIKVYKFNYAKLQSFKDAITRFLEKEDEDIVLLSDKQLYCFASLEDWLRKLLNLFNNKINSAPETKKTLVYLPLDTNTEDSGLDTSIRRKNNQPER